MHENGSQKPLPFRNQNTLPNVRPLWYVSPMSKTDKTKPPTVQIAEKAIATHDHSNGECTLPPLAEWVKFPASKRWRGCTWEVPNWHNVKFSRTADEKDWLANKRKHKYPDWKAK